MLSKAFMSILALLSAFGTSVTASESVPMEDRVEARRLERLGASSSASSSSASFSRYRIRSSTSSLPGTVFDRVQDRLEERLEGIQQRSPEEYEAVIEMLQRREQRRADRMVTSTPSLKQQVIDGVNMERATRGIPALRHHRDLEAAAQLHAEDMIAREYFSHENPEGLRSGDRIKATGYGTVNAQECRCSYRVFLGENIAKGQTTATQVVAEWMDSPSHREAMLSRDYTEIGVGISGDIWVLNFGSVEINQQ